MHVFLCLAEGIHASTHEHAWKRAVSAKPAVLDSECQAPAANDFCTMAHVRYQEAARQADDKAAKARHGDPIHSHSSARCP